MTKEFNLSELADGISNQTGLGIETVKTVLNNLGILTANYLANSTDKRVEYQGLFIAKLVKKEASSGTTPDGVEWTKAAHYKVKLKAHKGFGDLVNANLPEDSPLWVLGSQEKAEKS